MTEGTSEQQTTPESPPEQPTQFQIQEPEQSPPAQEPAQPQPPEQIPEQETTAATATPAPSPSTDGEVGAVLIVGGGISGMQSALDLAESGYLIYLVDKSPSIGGAMAQLDKTFPTNDCAMCIMAPKLVSTGRHHNIRG